MIYGHDSSYMTHQHFTANSQKFTSEQKKSWPPPHRKCCRADCRRYCCVTDAAAALCWRCWGRCKKKKRRRCNAESYFTMWCENRADECRGRSRQQCLTSCPWQSNMLRSTSWRSENYHSLASLSCLRLHQTMSFGSFWGKKDLFLYVARVFSKKELLNHLHTWKASNIFTPSRRSRRESNLNRLAVIDKSVDSCSSLTCSGSFSCRVSITRSIWLDLQTGWGSEASEPWYVVYLSVRHPADRKLQRMVVTVKCFWPPDKWNRIILVWSLLRPIKRLSSNKSLVLGSARERKAPSARTAAEAVLNALILGV